MGCALFYRNREQQEAKTEMKKFEERMETLREELRRERDVSHRKTSKDINEVGFHYHVII